MTAARRASVARIVEFTALFVLAPALLALFMHPGLLFPAIWLLFAICLTALLLDRTFDRERLWNWAGVRRHVPLILGLGLVGAILLTAVLYVAAPGSLFGLIRTRPQLWAMIMVLYPVLSVYPQEVAFRAYFFHRYQRLFGDGPGILVASALAFGWAHIVMRNGWAIGFSTIGGMLFGLTYLRTKSLAAACLEHAMYGCFLFTIGWGAWFYSGAIR